MSKFFGGVKGNPSQRELLQQKIEKLRHAFINHCFQTGITRLSSLATERGLVTQRQLTIVSDKSIETVTAASHMAPLRYNSMHRWE